MVLNRTEKGKSHQSQDGSVSSRHGDWNYNRL